MNHYGYYEYDFRMVPSSTLEVGNSQTQTETKVTKETKETKETKVKTVFYQYMLQVLDLREVISLSSAMDDYEEPADRIIKSITSAIILPAGSSTPYVREKVMLKHIEELAEISDLNEMTIVVIKITETDMP